jgi:hypothetical protein
VPTIVFTNTMMIGPTVPPHTASTLCIVLNGWGPNVPPGAPTAPGGDGRFPRMVETLAAAAAMGELPGTEEDSEEPPPDHRRRTRRR